jgi:hypothetical protein
LSLCSPVRSWRSGVGRLWDPNKVCGRCMASLARSDSPDSRAEHANRPD